MSKIRFTAQVEALGQVVAALKEVFTTVEAPVDRLSGQIVGLSRVWKYIIPLL